MKLKSSRKSVITYQRSISSELDREELDLPYKDGVLARQNTLNIFTPRPARREQLECQLG